MNSNNLKNAKNETRKRKRKVQYISMLGVLIFLFIGGFIWGTNRPDNQREANEGGDSAIASNTNSNNQNDSDNQDDSDNGDEPEEPDDSDENTIRLQFAGDVFMHAGPIEVGRTGANTFDFKPFLTHIRPFIDGDFAIANMEVPVDARGNNQDVAGWPNFNTPFEILEAVQYAGFNHMITANNHSFDFGLEGLLNTVNSFERAGLDHTGMNVDWNDFNAPTLVDVNGITVGVIAYTDSVNGLEHMVPEASRSYAVRRFRSHTLDDIDQMSTDVANLREAGAELVVVALHWGAEYGDEPLEMQRLIARQLIDAGVDVIMGKHSHTVHPVEWHYRSDGTRGFIIYSLGNFLADQTRLFPDATRPTEVLYRGWNSGANTNFAGRTQFGMLVTLEATRDEDGQIRLETADVLPTLTLRDFSGNTLGTVDGVSVMPLINGELPDFVADEELRNWGQVAYEHVVSIVGEEFIRNSAAN